MMKKYFTDGLIQIAIVLSLLRTDINLNNLQNYVNNYPEIHEIILGSSSAYTQTNIHSQSWISDGNNGFAHPKSIDNYYSQSILSELHSLGRYRRVGLRNHDINAWLVVGQSMPIGSEGPVGSPTQAQIPSHANSNDNHAHAEPEGAVAPPENNSPILQPTLDLPFPGSELSKEDVDLIEILWRQDMDLGVGREMYDLNMRKELEKEKELELLKEKDKEEQEKLLQEKAQEQQQQEQNITFVVDGETGEVTAVPLGELPTSSQGQPPQTAVDGYQVLEEELQQQQQEQQQQHQQLQQQQQQQQQLQRNIQVQNSGDLQDEIEAIIAQNYSNPQQEDAQAQAAYEQQWAEVQELLTQQGLDLNNSGALLQNATLSEAVNPTPGGFNQTVAELSSAVPGGYAMMPPSAMTNQTFEPFPAAQAVNSSMQGDATFGSLFNLDSPDLMFSNMSAGGADMDVDRNSTLNHTENLLNELLEQDLSNIQFSGLDSSMIQTLQESLIGNDASSDSAVSSMSSPSHLDVNETASVFSDHPSMYDGLQGATGGSDYDSAGEGTHNKVAKHMTYDPQYGHHDFSYMSDTAGMNHSIASNDSDNHYADMTQVSHNHTYPLPQGQENELQQVELHQNQPSISRSSRPSSSKKSKKNKLPEYETKYASARDIRKARQLKVPFNMETIIHTSVDEFNDLLSKYDLTEPQLQLIRDIRRRGKNKVAAQNCRKRKLDVILTLEEEVMRMRQKKEELQRERQLVQRERAEMKHKLDVMYREVLDTLRDENGQPYDPTRYCIQHAEDGSVLVVPRNTTMVQEHKDKSSKKKKSSKKN